MGLFRGRPGTTAKKNGILIVLFCMGTKLPDGAGQ
jgi:hypothetical protein